MQVARAAKRQGMAATIISHGEQWQAMTGQAGRGGGEGVTGPKWSVIAISLQSKARLGEIAIETRATTTGAHIF